MTVGTIDGILAGMQAPRDFTKSATPTLVVGRPHSLWYLTGNPGAGVADTTTAGGVARSSSSALVAGQIPHTDPLSGTSYLARFQAQCSQGGTLFLCDRLLDCGAVSTGTALSATSTATQTINSTTGTVTLPARDNAGSTNGDGVLWGLEFSTASGTGTNVPTIGYTNQAGTTGRTAGLIDTYVASSAIGAFYRFALQSGDTGIRSVQTYTNSVSMSSGQPILVAYRVLARLSLPISGNAGVDMDAVTAAFPQMMNGVVPMLLLLPNATTAATVSGYTAETQG